MDTVLETKICRIWGVPFTILDGDRIFLDQISPTFAGKKYLLPNPTLCPEARQQHRMAWRNETSLYKRKCDMSGRGIISVYSEDKPYKVYASDIRRSDKRDALDYGQDYDFAKKFFVQYDALLKSVPMMATTIEQSENCEYTNDAGDSKDCYMSFRVHYCENVLYSYRPNRSHDCIDCSQIKESENLYECFQCEKCQNSMYLYNCSNCFKSTFCRGCESCSYCFMCYNLHHKQYCIGNKQYTKETYETEIKKYENLSYEQYISVRSTFINNLKNTFFRDLDIVGSENCVGDLLLNCANIIDGFSLKNSSNLRYCYDNNKYTNSMDCYSGGGGDYCYYTSAIGRSFNIRFSLRMVDSTECRYCMYCFACKNCFGCVGLRNREFCIFNKQYTPAEYDKTVAQIIEHMMSTNERGEFPPVEYSPFAYNETGAQEYYPLDQTQIIAKGWKYKEDEDKTYTGPVYVPKHIRDYDPSIIGEEIAQTNRTELMSGVLKCITTGVGYKIIPQELEFYITNHLPIPLIGSKQRNKERMKFVNPRKLSDRTCDKCGVAIKTSYPLSNPIKIYCSKCYDSAVYG